MSNDPLLDVEDIEVAYGKARAVNGATVRVQRGSITAIVGPNGAGKTTLLKAVCGLQPLRAGEIRWDGHRIDGRASREIAALGIAHVPEGRRVFGKMTVLENLRLGAYLRRDAADVERTLDFVFAAFPRLKERETQRAGSLSGGEQQMLAIGRALMSRPKLILFDEPSLGLAPNIVERTFEIIQRIRAEGTTVLMVEQNAYAALDMCDRAYLLESGTLTLEGTGRELIDNPHVRKAYLGGRGHE